MRGLHLRNALRWRLLVIGSCLGAFFVGCQEAAIDAQRSLIQAVAFRISDLLFATTV